VRPEHRGCKESDQVRERVHALDQEMGIEADMQSHVTTICSARTGPRSSSSGCSAGRRLVQGPSETHISVTLRECKETATHDRLPAERLGHRSVDVVRPRNDDAAR
jgi:hypothetical protein